jgi:hypothetical protein
MRLQTTPAMAAKVTEQIWGISDISWKLFKRGK